METLDTRSAASRYSLDVNFPSCLLVSAGIESIQIEAGDTAYGYVQEGDVTLCSFGLTQTVRAGMYFSIPGPADLSAFIGLLSIRKGYIGLPTFGGPVERLGRLRYIDGCSDSLLIGPPVKGDPCLNYLYVPPYLNQTAHTHPSVRLGIVIEGHGYCLTPDGKHDLIAGEIFVLPPEEVHSFHTDDKPLRIVVYHPDSDFGPSHEQHPMINRTYVDGVSLSGDNQYRTREIAESLAG